MATTTYTVEEKSDDLEAHRGNGKVEATETVQFTWKNSGPMEIDLTQVNDSAVSEIMDELVAAGRKAKTRSGTKKATTSSSTSSTPRPASSSGANKDNHERREFWQAVLKTHPRLVPDYSERGRIPNTVGNLYDRTPGETVQEKLANIQNGSADGEPSAETQGESAVSADGNGADLPSPTDEDGERSEDQGERLPRGWEREDDGSLRDAHGFLREEHEIAEELNAV
jgi:hypothetical protein